MDYIINNDTVYRRTNVLFIIYNILYILYDNIL